MKIDLGCSWYKYSIKKDFPRNEKEYVVNMIDKISLDSLRYRISNLLIWYIKKAEYNKRMYYGLMCITFGANAAIPIINLLGTESSIVVSSICAGLAATALAVNNLYHFKENWTRYRKSAEEIKELVSNYLIQLEICNKENKECQKSIVIEENIVCKLQMGLIGEIERIVGSERNNWYEVHTEQSQSKDDDRDVNREKR